MSTDSDRKPEASERLGAQRGVAITDATSAERATHPEFAEPMQPPLSVEAADSYADSIRPAWEELSFRTLRPPAHHRPGRERALPVQPFGVASASTPPPLLSADEADAYAARIQPSWAPPPAWSAPQVPEDMAVVTSEQTQPPSAGWVEPEVEPDRTRVLRAALIAAGFAVAGAAVGALLALAPRLGSSAPPIEAMEKTKISAITAETGASALSRPLAPAPPAAASSETIRVRIAAEPARAKIVLDGVEVPNPFDDRRLKGGRHRVLIRAKGHATRDLTLTFERDEHVRVALQPLPQSRP